MCKFIHEICFPHVYVCYETNWYHHDVRVALSFFRFFCCAHPIHFAALTIEYCRIYSCAVIVIVEYGSIWDAVGEITTISDCVVFVWAWLRNYGIVLNITIIKIHTHTNGKNCVTLPWENITCECTDKHTHTHTHNWWNPQIHIGLHCLIQRHTNTQFSLIPKALVKFAFSATTFAMWFPLHHFPITVRDCCAKFICI